MQPQPSLNTKGYSFTSIFKNSSKARVALMNCVSSASEDIFFHE